MQSRYLLFVLLIILGACNPYSEHIEVTIKQSVIPVLIMKETNPVLMIRLIKDMSYDCNVEKIVLSLEGTSNLDDIESVSLYGLDKQYRIRDTMLLGSPQRPANEILFQDNFLLSRDTTTLGVSVKLKRNAGLSHRINVVCKSIQTTDGKVKVPLLPPSSGLRVGVAVRQHKQDGVDTYRIPGLTTSKKGTLLAIYDARRDNSRDLQGNIDICLNRSLDGGQTWEPLQTVLDMKEWGGLPEKYNGVSDADILVDEKTGDIYVAGLWMHGVLDGNTGKWVQGLTQDSTRWIHQWREKGSQPGLGVKETCQFLITKSMDDGLTWSAPVNITAQTKQKDWWLYAPAPGHGITLKDGTLVFPTQGRDLNGLPFSNITWSKDGGKTWRASNPAFSDVTECMAVQLSDGRVMLNMRDNRNRIEKENGRRICVTSDLGESWMEHPTSRNALIEPVCMGCIHRHAYKENGMEKSLLLFSNPDSKTDRNHMSVKVSFDDGNTWPEEHKIVLDEYNSFGYSCITSVNDSVIGILYESSQAQMVFQQIQLKELLPR